MDEQALTYVLAKARVDDVNITQEQGRQSLGALGLSGEMALARIGTPLCGQRQCMWQEQHCDKSCCSCYTFRV